MKLVTFSVVGPGGRENRLGILVDGDETGRVADATNCYAAHLAHGTDEPLPRELAVLRTPPDMLGWLEGGGKSLEAAKAGLGFANECLKSDAKLEGLDGAPLIYERQDIRLESPLPWPTSFRDFSVYEDHMSKSPLAQPGTPKGKRPAFYKFPTYYKGLPSSFAGPEDPVPFPYFTKMLDLELEIAIIVGREGRNLSVEEAGDYIAGYALLVDSSGRDHFDREFLGPTKNKDFHVAMGPFLVTADETNDQDKRGRLSVEGETWWEGNTSDGRQYLAEHLIAYASDNESIYPGDVLGTGTIGASCSMDTGRWIEVGQTAKFEIEGLGAMELEVVQGDHEVDHINGMEGLLKAPGG